MINYNKIKGRMRELGVSQRELAKELRLTEYIVNRKLSGKSQIKLSEAKKISEVLKFKDEFFDYFFSDWVA